MNEKDEKLEQNLIDMVKQKEEADKLLLNLEIILGLVMTLFFFGVVIIASLIDVSDNVRLAIIIPAFVLFFIACFAMINIERRAGYYECQKCHHKYVPSYSSVLWAMHMGRTRYMKCPECGKRSWQKKVISKD